MTIAVSLTGRLVESVCDLLQNATVVKRHRKSISFILLALVIGCVCTNLPKTGGAGQAYNGGKRPGEFTVLKRCIGYCICAGDYRF